MSWGRNACLMYYLLHIARGPGGKRRHLKSYASHFNGPPLDNSSCPPNYVSLNLPSCDSWINWLLILWRISKVGWKSQRTFFFNRALVMVFTLWPSKGSCFFPCLTSYHPSWVLTMLMATNGGTRDSNSTCHVLSPKRSNSQLLSFDSYHLKIVFFWFIYSNATKH